MHVQIMRWQDGAKVTVRAGTALSGPAEVKYAVSEGTVMKCQVFSGLAPDKLSMQGR